ncbi:MAG: hypothetical protein KatS3mg125_0160 [Lysobacterales bacterium]|nr:MAG: hypothetical protein KatS3mg125_0160 [Xanthomonadales bacterium]
MDLDALREKIGGRLIVRLLGHREHLTGGAHDRFLAIHELADHLLRWRHAGFLPDAGQLGELGVAARGGVTQGADALGDLVHRHGELVVLLLEQEVQRLEHRSGDVPMEIVGLEVQGVGVGEEPGQPLGDAGAILFADADIDGTAHDVLPIVVGCLDDSFGFWKNQ